MHNLTTQRQYYPYGEKPRGVLLFSAEGFMFVAVMADKRAPFAGESLQAASPEEKIRATESYLSYAGKWRIEDNKIYVQVTVSLLPNWTDKEHFRSIALNDNALVFQTPVMRQKESELLIELTWRKV